MAGSAYDAIPDLPHWARVAFAARCGRAVWPLFARAWPNALPERTDAVLTAIRLSEESASWGVQADGLKNARLQATITAGAAFSPHIHRDPQRPDDPEPKPAGRQLAVVAILAAKVAEMAALAAEDGPDGSAEAAGSAFGFMMDACNEAGDGNPWDQLEVDFATLARAARRGGWTDRTPVPPSVFDGGTGKRWWRVW
jgi:hypothetical protein